MFERLKRAVDAALGALEAKAGGRPEEELRRLLAGMREELIDARARIPKLEAAVAETERALRHETGKAEECARRALQAERAGDRETVEVALRFEARHRAAADVLGQKLEAGRAELALQRRTVEEMTTQLKGAIARRDALAARARRAGATERVRADRPGVLDELDRLVERIEGEEAAARAAAEVDDTLSAAGDPGPEPLDPEELAELRLRELKRRMADERERGGG